MNGGCLTYRPPSFSRRGKFETRRTSSLTLPFDLNGQRADEPPLFQEIPSRWTHVITIEPMFDRGEDFLTDRPFPMQPYRNPYGQGPPNEGREVEYHSEFVPSGTATLVRWA